MPKNVPPLNRALTCLRSAQGWLQGELAAAACVSPSLLSDYECGRKALSLARLRDLVAVLGLDLAAIDHSLSFLEEVYRAQGDALALRLLAEARYDMAAMRRASGGDPVIAAAAAGGRERLPAAPQPGAARAESAALPVAAEIERDQRRLVVGQIRLLRCWTQKQLAAAAGVAASSISNYERGAIVPTRKTIERLAAAAGVSGTLLSRIGGFLSAASASLQGSEREAVVEREAGTSARIEVSVSIQAERQQASRTWSQLAQCTAAERRLHLERDRAGATWALCELVCAESLKAAAEVPSRALELADLALRSAEMCSGPEALRLRVVGYARAHRANAYRVSGDLPAAERELAVAKRLWGAGAAAGPELLNRSKVASLEVSLLICQQRVSEAIEIVDRALDAPHPQELATLLILKMNALSTLGRHRKAIRVIRQLRPALALQAEPRVAACARYALLSSLCNSGHYRRAEPLLAGLREDLVKLGNEVDLLRVDYMEARVAAGLGMLEEAIEIFGEVREAFLARKMNYDAAWAGLKLARLLRGRGRTAESREVTRHAETVFRDAGLPRGFTAHAMGDHPAWPRRM